MSSLTEQADKPSEEHADHAAQKAQGDGCCGTHEHGHSNEQQQRDEPADRSAQKAQGGGCCDG